MSNQEENETNSEQVMSEIATESTQNDFHKSVMVLDTVQKIYDQLIDEAKEEAAILITEAEETRDRLVSEGRERHDYLVLEAEAKAAEMIETANHDIKEWRETTEQEVEDRLEDLKLEETELLERVEKLRMFESKYRKSLEAMIDKANKSLQVPDFDKHSAQESENLE